ncbi:hypothetical protein DYD21_07195 [Rhodohalobacter sp. SW132]|nr:hypothetical protein [Rhodohalobacter sp. SW132]REL37911.1 hypothetical protein DYD21_07195 [Rhodohalobacter sp. SW132]
MIHDFTTKNVDEIADVLEVKPKLIGKDLFRFELENEDKTHRLALEIHLGLEVDGKKLNMVSVYSGGTFLQLHNCTAFVASKMLKQVTFFGKQNGITSGLIVEVGAGCSLYANVGDEILTGDFTKLPEDLMMCGVALSLTETEGFDDFTYEEEDDVS